MKPFEVFQKYIAIKLHFTTKNYDYHKFRGKSKVSFDTYLKRKDKFFFEKLAKKYKEEEIEDIFVSNHICDENFWIGNAFNDTTIKNYAQWKNKILSFSYLIENDISNVQEVLGEKNFIELIKFSDGYPELFNLYLNHKISIEFLIVVDILFNVIEYWETKINNDMVFSHYSTKIKKYRNFLEKRIEIKKVKKIFKEKIK
jgi:hypothetical protein